MAALSSDDYNLRTVNKEVIVSALPVKDYQLPLSNLDLNIPPVLVRIFLCYNKPTTMSKSSFAELAIHELKSSLSEALVYYYVFAGKMVLNNSRDPEVLCNNQGVEYIVANANIGLAQLEFYNPDKTVEEKLVPVLSNSSVFAFQET